MPCRLAGRAHASETATRAGAPAVAAERDRLAASHRIARAQPQGQEHAAGCFEDEQRVVHGGVVVGVIERERLLPVGRVFGGVCVEDDLLLGLAVTAEALGTFALEKTD